MDQASALLAASCERNPAAPRTSSSCSRFEDRSQTGALPPARLDPQSAPHAAPSSRDPRPSSPALCSTQRDICCRIFTPAQPEYPAASVRDNCSGAYNTLVVLNTVTDPTDYKSAFAAINNVIATTNAAYHAQVA